MDRDALLKPRLPERAVDVPGVGTVRIRGLSRKEVQALRGFADDPDAGEVYVLATAFVDPELTEDDVRYWMDAAAHTEVLAVLDAVFEMSGLKEQALKDAVRTFRGEPGEASGVHPGPGTEDDGR